MPWIFVPRPAHAKGVPLESMVYTNTLSDICPCGTESARHGGLL